MNFENIEQNEGFEKKLYTGVMPVRITKVNPSITELAKMYGKSEEEVREPNYQGDENTRLDFYYQNHASSSYSVNNRFALFISTKKREIEGEDGKLLEFIDDYGHKGWYKNLEELKEKNITRSQPFDLATVRQAKEGESKLYALLRAYANVTKSSPVKLDNFDALVRGNYRELNEQFFAHFNDTKYYGGYGMGVKLLLGIKEGKYQDVYTGVFTPLNQRSLDWLEKNARGEYKNPFKSYWRNNLTLQEFTPEESPAVAVTPATGGYTDVTNVTGVANTTPATSDDDNPFFN